MSNANVFGYVVKKKKIINVVKNVLKMRHKK